MPKLLTSSKAFTLVEILVVVSILGVLITLSIAGMRGAQASARDADRRTDLEDIRSALEIYRADCGSYPATITGGQPLQGTGSCAANTYMTQVPRDPQYQRLGYEYEYVLSGNTYTLCAFIETSQTAPSLCANSPNRDCGTTGCTYSVRNP